MPQSRPTSRLLLSLCYSSELKGLTSRNDNIGRRTTQQLSEDPQLHPIHQNGNRLSVTLNSTVATIPPVPKRHPSISNPFDWSRTRFFRSGTTPSHRMCL